MRLREIMKTKVETITPSESVATALERMRANRIRHLVVTHGRQVVGVLSDRDLGRRVGDRIGQSVEEAMTSPVVTATPETSLKQAANLMRGHAIGCIPIVADQHLAGIVTVTDLLELIGRGVERPMSKAPRWVMKDRGPRRRVISAGGNGTRARRPR
jgi:acetoin utilization protein AcuB